jgi:methylenetetrahydrofolate reductase (NADPH)
MTATAPVHFSYEFFPPRSLPMQNRLWRAIGQLERFGPSFFSMTYGAQGSAREVSIDTALAMHRESPVPIAAHLTCCAAPRAEVDAVARGYYEAGIRRIVALRGDRPQGTAPAADEYDSVIELIESLRELGEIDISVAAYPEPHPQAKSALADLRHLQRKLEAGADRAITQYFFEADCFLRFRDRAARLGIDKPLVPGILPVHDIERVRRFSERCGASVPADYGTRFAKVEGRPEEQYRLALELAVELCERLIDEGVDRFHFYTLNQTDLCLDISLALGASLKPPQLISAA